MADETGKKRKGTALLAVMNENCTSCAGSPLCELHCPVDNCINLLYEETPQRGLKPYRVWVDNEKCIGCQMCYSDDLTKIHQHKESGEIYYEYASRYYNSSKKLLEPSEVPRKFLLQLVGDPVWRPGLFRHDAGRRSAASLLRPLFGAVLAHLPQRRSRRAGPHRHDLSLTRAAPLLDGPHFA